MPILALDCVLKGQILKIPLKSGQVRNDYATSSSSLSDAEFDDVCMTVLCVNKELKAVLTSPRFRNDAAQQAAAAVNVG